MNKNFRNKLKINVNVGGTKNKENNIQQLLTPFWKELKITNKRNLKISILKINIQLKF